MFRFSFWDLPILDVIEMQYFPEQRKARVQKQWDDMENESLDKRISEVEKRLSKGDYMFAYKEFPKTERAISFFMLRPLSGYSQPRDMLVRFFNEVGLDVNTKSLGETEMDLRSWFQKSEIALTDGSFKFDDKKRLRLP